MFFRTAPYFAAVLLPLAMALPGGPVHAPTTINRAQEQKLRQSGAPPVVKEIRRIANRTGAQWKLLVGPGNATAHAGKALYILPAHDTSQVILGQEAWHLPGRLIDAGNNQCFYQADVFAGEVLRDTIGVIWYDRTLMPDGRWKENTTLLNLSSAVPDTLVFFGHGRRSTTLGLAFRGKCALMDTIRQTVHAPQQ
ncbi:MAG: hypothetical protein IT230_01480 [Flavobacteriales bacterium]|nr:hypothetical protein [Flavobacteriales bacterium]